MTCTKFLFTLTSRVPTKTLTEMSPIRDLEALLGVLEAQLKDLKEPEEFKGNRTQVEYVVIEHEGLVKTLLDHGTALSEDLERKCIRGFRFRAWGLELEVASVLFGRAKPGLSETFERARRVRDSIHEVQGWDWTKDMLFKE